LGVERIYLATYNIPPNEKKHGGMPHVTSSGALLLGRLWLFFFLLFLLFILALFLVSHFCLLSQVVNGIN
jgi:hypothetical protein